MFDFLYFDLTKFYSLQYFLEGKPVAQFANWLLNSVMLGLTDLFWGWYIATTGHDGFWWTVLAVAVWIGVVILIALLWTYGLVTAIAAWCAWWFIWYFVWKFFLCLICTVIWNVVVWIVIHAIAVILVGLFYLGPGFATGYIFQNITGDHWARRMFATSLWGLASIILFHFSSNIGVWLSVWHYCTSLIFWHTFDFDKNWFRKLSPTS